MNSFCVSSSYLSFFFFFFSPAFAWGSVFLPSVIRLLSNLFPSLSQFLLLSAPQSAPSRFGPIPPLTLSRTHMHTTQNCARLDGWSPSAPPLSPSCLMQSAAPYWLGSATAASCAAVCLRDTKASCEPGHVLTGWKNTWQKKVWAEFRSCWKVNCGAFVLKTGCRRRKDFPLRGLWRKERGKSVSSTCSPHPATYPAAVIATITPNLTCTRAKCTTPKMSWL